MIMIFVEFINQLIDYSINCATLGGSADKSLKQANIPTPFATHQTVIFVGTRSKNYGQSRTCIQNMYIAIDKALFSIKNIGPSNRAGTINLSINSTKMTIITDSLIIDHLISVFVTLPYLPFVFRHLISLPYFI